MKKKLVLVLAAAFSLQANAGSFVQVEGARLVRSGKPYQFMGTNFWYGMNLGRKGAPRKRARLVRELDRLESLGVKNLRIMAATEGPDSEPWRVTPSLQPRPATYREDLLRGLDFLLAEMKKRDMTAVVCLNNFWPWSGGMSQYLRWAGALPIPYPPPHPGGSWAGYQAYTEQFYSNRRAVDLSHRLVEEIVTRRNSLTGRLYSDDATVMAWELANEPRGGANVADYRRWIARTAALIQSLDGNHLVTIGSEGETPWPEGNGVDPVADHAVEGIDYMTAHIWAQNWGWFDPSRSAETLPVAIERMSSYIDRHAGHAAKLGMPLVIEEFGFPRDGGSHDPDSATRTRDHYYGEVFKKVLAGIQSGTPLAGVNFWAWAGEGRPKRPYGGIWESGDPLTGDPPHEHQGWYSVYSRDDSTLHLIRDFSVRFGE